MNHGRDSIYIGCSDDGKEGQNLQEIIDRRFSFIHVGHSYRATELEAAIGLGQMERSDEVIERRQQIAQKYTLGLENLSEFIQLPTIPDDRTQQTFYRISSFILCSSIHFVNKGKSRLSFRHRDNGLFMGFTNNRICF